MFISTLRWRQAFDVEGLVKEQFPQDIFGELGKIYGKDKGGHPVSYVDYNLRSWSLSVWVDTIFMVQTRILMLSSGTFNGFCGVSLTL